MGTRSKIDIVRIPMQKLTSSNHMIALGPNFCIKSLPKKAEKKHPMQFTKVKIRLSTIVIYGLNKFVKSKLNTYI